MKKLVMQLALAAALVACAKTAPAGELRYQTLEYQGHSRRYALYLPAGRDGRPLPLVFSLHGGGVSLEDQLGARGFKSPFKLWMELADREGFIVVYPEGLPGAYGTPSWNDCRADANINSGADDVGFLLAVLERVAAGQPVDRNRVYASGISNGGFMALRLAVEAPGSFAAVAAICAAMPAASECAPPRRAVPVLFMNGTADPNMPYRGGVLGNPADPAHGTVLSTPDSVEIWRSLAAASPQDPQTLPDLDPDDGGTVSRRDYLSGGRVWVRLYTVSGGGHAAPSLAERYSRLFESRFGHQNHDLEASAAIWEFFAGR
ncbi:alpha/beta hydrolase family esterase [Oceanithermus sp.]